MSKFNTHGGYFAPLGYTKIEEGGSHEENPNGGVQLGIDPEGTPNLVEQDEVVYDDYVYSDNIRANKSLLKKHNLHEKYAGKLYSEIADIYVDEVANMPNDPIANNGLRAMLTRLADAQEEQKQLSDQKKLENELSKLSPEQLMQLEDMLAQQEQDEEKDVQQQVPMQEQPMEQVMAHGGYLPNIYDGRTKNTSRMQTTEENAAGLLQKMGELAQYASNGTGNAVNASANYFNTLSDRDAARLYMRIEKNYPVYKQRYLDAANRYQLVKQQYDSIDPTLDPDGTQAANLQEQLNQLAATMNSSKNTLLSYENFLSWNDAKSPGTVKRDTYPLRDGNFESYASGLMTNNAAVASAASASPSAQSADAAVQASGDPKPIGSMPQTQLKPQSVRTGAGTGARRGNVAPAQPAQSSEPERQPIQRERLATNNPFSDVRAVLPAIYTQETILGEPVPVKPVNAVSSTPALPTIARYAGAIGNGLMGLYNAFQKPNQLQVMETNPVLPTGRMDIQEQVYNPVDQNMVANQILAQSAGTARGLQNSGLGPSTAAALLAADRQAATNLGTGLLQVYDANNQRRNAVITANNAARAQKAQFDAGLSQARAGILNNDQLMRQRNDIYRQQWNDQQETAQYGALSSAINAGLTDLSRMGNENFMLNQANNSGLPYRVNPNGTVTYIGENDDKKKRCGGTLLKRYK